ncbi:hypothetical protein [Erwinia phage vB_Ea277G]|nr:hypothetical protein [Erwinia phage vB_Ea277G]
MQQYHFCIHTQGKLDVVDNECDVEVRINHKLIEAMQHAFKEYIAVGVCDFEFTLSKVAGDYFFDPTTHSLIHFTDEQRRIIVTEKLKEECVAAMALDTERTYTIVGKASPALTEVMMQIH